jgi:hypothetical protein
VLEPISIAHRRNSDDAHVSVEWKSTSLGAEFSPIPADVLCHDEAHISGSPFHVTVLPGSMSAASVKLLAVPRNLQGGEAFSVGIWAGDTFNNSVSGAQGQLAVRLKPPDGQMSRTVPFTVREGSAQTFVMRSGGLAAQVAKNVGYVAESVAPTRSGTHLLVASLALAGGLAATYYNNESPNTDPRSARVDGSVDFSLDSSALPAASLTAGSKYSVVWAGLVRTQYANLHTFYAGVVSEDQRVKLWIDNSILIDQWASLAATEASGTIMASSADAYYDIRLEYKRGQSSSTSGAKLRWASNSVPKQAVPSSRLYRALDVVGSPSAVSVLPGPLHAASSKVNGMCLTLATSGAACTLTISLRDKYGVPTPTFAELRAYLSDNQQGATTTLPKPQCDSETCTFSFSPATSGTQVLSVVHIPPSGSPADALHLAGSPFLVQVLKGRLAPTRCIAFGTGLTLATAGVPVSFTLRGRDSFGEAVHIHPRSLQVRLHSIDSQNAGNVGTVRLPHDATDNGVVASLLLTRSGTFFLNIKYAGAHVQGSPFQMVSRSDQRFQDSQAKYTCNTMSLATAGMGLSRLVQITDSYGNIPDSAQVLVRAHARRELNSDMRPAHYVAATVTQKDAFVYNVSVITTISGRYMLWAHYSGGTGLAATYFDGPEMASPKVVRKDNTVDFSLANTGRPSSSLTSGAAYSVRWSAWVYPQHAQMYTFFAGLRSSVDRVRLWVDDHILVDQWTSLDATEAAGILSFPTANAYYDLTMEYKRPAAGNDHGVSLQWQSASVTKTVLPSGRLYAAYSLAELQSKFETSPAAVCASSSSFSGTSVSLWTAGVEMTYTIQSRDAYGNAQDPVADSKYMVVVPALNLSEAAANEGYVGGWSARFLTTKAGVYATSLVLTNVAGIQATYYNDVFMRVPVASHVQEAVNASWGFASPHSAVGSDFFSVRWAGRISVVLPGTYSLHMYADDCATLWLDGLRVLDSCGADDVGVTCADCMEYPGRYRRAHVSLQAGRTYDIELHHFETTGKAVCRLLVSRGASSLQPLGFPTNGVRLVTDPRVADGTFNAMVVSGRISSGLQCSAHGRALTIASAGTESTFIVRCTDKFGNVLDDSNIAAEQQLFGTVSGDSSRNIFVRFTYEGSGVYLGMYSASISSANALRLGVQFPGGLASTYYDDPFLFTGDTTRHNLAPEPLATTTFGSISSYKLSRTSSFGMRWAGVVQPPSVGTYTFAASIGGASQRVKLWVDNALIVDAWSSIYSLLPSGTIVLSDAAVRYELLLEYAQPSGSGSLDLQMGYGSSPPATIPTSRLFYTSNIQIPQAGTLSIATSSICAATTTVDGSGLTLATAGQSAYFTIRPRDVAGNVKTDQDAAFVVRIGNTVERNLVAVTHMEKLGSFLVNYTAKSASASRPVYVSLAWPGGLAATYFDADDLSSAVTTRVDNTIDFSRANTGTPSSSLASSSNYAVRWSGFVRPQFAQAYTFVAGLESADQRARLWVDNRLLVDQWASLAATNPSGSLSFQISDALYDIVLEYKRPAAGSAHGIKLSWSSLQPFWPSVSSSIIPSIRFFQDIPIAGSPYTSVTAQCGTCLCGSTSTARGTSLSLMTAGAAAVFTVTTRDDAGATQSSSDNLPQGLYAAIFGPSSNASSSSAASGTVRLACTSTQCIGSAVPAAPTVSGWYSLNVVAARAGALSATYYSNIYAEIISDGAYSSIQMIGQPAQTGTVLTIQPLSTHTSVRWAGYVRPAVSETFTFNIETTCSNSGAENDNGLIMYVDNRKILDSWTTCSPSVSGTAPLIGGNLHEISIAYKHLKGSATVALSWQSFSVRRSPITSNRILHFVGHVHGSPFRCFVSPAAASSSNTIVSVPLDLTFTAGVPVKFTVAAVDSYGNVRDQLGTLVGYVSRPTQRHSHSSVNLQAGTGSILSYDHTSAGLATVSGWLAISSGLSATYYNDLDTFGAPASSRVDSAIDFSQASGGKPAATLASASSYAVRWSGFVRPAAAQEYTFYAGMQDASQRLRLWVDNVLTMDQWTSLSGTESSGTISFPTANDYYDIVMDYKLPGITGAGHGASLKWSSVSGSVTKAVVPAGNLFQAQLLFSRTAIFFPSTISGLRTVVAGSSLSLVTAGVYSHFTVFARDTYGNARPCAQGELGMDTNMLPTQASFTSECLDGQYKVRFLPQAAAGSGYMLHVLAGSTEVHGSPFSTTVVTGMTNTTTSSVSGNAYTLATAGIAASFSITARDSYGSLQTDGYARFVMFIGGKITGTVSGGHAGVYVASYLLTSSSVYSTEIHVASSPGLLLSVDTTPNSENGRKWFTTLDQSHVSFYGSPSPYADATAYFAAKWEGMIWPQYAQTFSFVIQVADSSDRVRLWVDNALVIDQWSSLASLQATSTCSFGNTGGKQFVLQYTHVKNTAGLSLQWATNYPVYLARQEIPMSFFSLLPYAGQGRLGTLNVLVGSLTGSIVKATGLSLLTAGTSSAFTIEARDSWGNSPDPQSYQDYSAHLQGPLNAGLRASHAIITKLEGLRYAATIAAPLSSGSGFLLSILYPESGGLFATYYDSAGLVASAAKSSRIDSTIDFSHAAGIRNAASLSAANAFSVRWAGLVRPQFAQLYTFYAGVRSITERMRLWIDNSILVDEWTHLGQTESSGTISFGSADGYYSVLAEYQQVATSSALNGFTLSWETAMIPKAPVPANHLWKPNHLSSSPLAVTVRSAVVCASTSTLSGVALTGSVPYLSSFTITARDAYGNALDGTNTRVSFLVRAATADNR